MSDTTKFVSGVRTWKSPPSLLNLVHYYDHRGEGPFVGIVYKKNDNSVDLSYLDNQGNWIRAVNVEARKVPTTNSYLEV